MKSLVAVVLLSEIEARVPPAKGWLTFARKYYKSDLIIDCMTMDSVLVPIPIPRPEISIHRGNLKQPKR